MDDDSSSGHAAARPGTAGDVSADERLAGVARRVREITRENERLFGELVAGERRFRGLAKAVWKVQEEERRRLARELHDGIGQTLTALKNQLEWLERRAPADESREGLATAVKLSARALEETRELSRLLRPAVLDDLGLQPALRWLARTLRQQTGLEVALELEANDGALDPDLETLVFRVTQEALNNVVKHAGVAAAEVRLRRRGDRLRLRIADRGDGFDPHSVLGPATGSSGVGLRGIRDRSELFGGKMRVESRPGEGTVVEVDLPFVGGEGEAP